MYGIKPGYVFREHVKASFQISYSQHWMYPLLSFTSPPPFHLRHKSTSKLRFLFLCTSTFLVQCSKLYWPPAAVMPVRVKNSTTGAGSDSSKKPKPVSLLIELSLFIFTSPYVSSSYTEECMLYAAGSILVHLVKIELSL
jgi:hypothetical protein